MKFLAISLFAAWSVVCAQTPAVPPSPAPAQAPPQLPNLPDATVIAEFPDGTQFTMGEFRKYFEALPPENQPEALRNPKLAIEGWAHLKQMSGLAIKEKLDQRSPLKEQIEMQRQVMLANAEAANKLLNIVVDGQEIAKRYDAEKEKYKQVKVSAIYISYGEKGVTEQQAKAKADKLLAQIRKGADFAKLARENTDDETGKSKDGFLAVLSQSDNIPDALRAAVFQLKEGETSEPVRQPNGFYLLRAGQITYKPLSDVRDLIFNDLKNQKFQEWLAEMSKQADPKFVNPAFPVVK
jgi:peptidyl-prolyl cis-trans isomerase C